MKAQKPRKARSDSVAEAVRLGTSFDAASRELSWPMFIPPALVETQREVELSLFDALLTARNPTDWTPYDVANVARLAGHVAMQLKDEDLLKKSGSLVKSPNNEKQFIRNPLIDVVATRQSIITSLSRQIGVSVPSVDLSVLKNSSRVVNAMPMNDPALSLLAS